MTRPAPCINVRTDKIIRLRNSPSWLPEKYRNRLERIRYSFRPCPGEKRLLRKKKMIQPSVWAERFRTVTYGPLKGSRWDNRFMPHMRGIMDASFWPSVRYIGNEKAPQTGSSAGMETMIGFVADMKPGAALITYPDRDTASKRSTDYLQPMFKESPRLRTLLTGTADDLSSMRVKLQTMLLYMGWAGSVTSLGNVSAMYLVADEVNKWPVKSSKKEADNIKLFYERFRAFKYGAKCWLISTPSDPEGIISVFNEKEAQVVFEYWISCPECGESHKMSFKQIRTIEECRDPKRIEEEDLARYVFPCCGLLADDVVRGQALETGFWCERISDEDKAAGVVPRDLMTCLEEMNPRKIGFHSPAWVSKLVTNSEMLAAFFRGMQDPAEMHYFDNQIAAKAHSPFRQNRKQDVILSLKDDRPAGLVPGGGKVSALVAGVDTQDNSFVFSIRAFGWGLEQPSWQVRFGEVTSLAAIEKVMFHDIYQDVDGLYYPVHLLVIDTGGHRASEVYDFARLHPGRAAAYKGASGRKASPYTKTVIDRYPGTKVAIPGGVELYICDTHHYKDQLAAKLRVKPEDPGEYRFHQEITEEYANQMCAEYVDDKRLWQCPKNKANHYWDCCVMELVAADLLQLKYLNQGE